MFGCLIDKLNEVYNLYISEDLLIAKQSYLALMAQLLNMVNDEFKKLRITDITL